MENTHLNLPKRIHLEPQPTYMINGIEFKLADGFSLMPHEYWDKQKTIQYQIERSKPTAQLIETPMCLDKTHSQEFINCLPAYLKNHF